jgi:aminoglycoside phosphotransferase (APT) family kinase protein
VWSGYGEIVRYALVGAAVPSVVVKHVVPGKGDGGRSHDRKLRSYEVEQRWYQEWAARCPASCRVPRCHLAERGPGEWLFVFEDLDHAGFERRARDLSAPQLDACLRWLAAFHATFLGVRPRGLWSTGTYWHLKTRPDEHRAMARGPLRDAAAAIDARLGAARFQTLTHGDAKPANFCFSADGRAVATVDFQYVGGGCGMKDVAYLLAGEDPATVERALEVYFAALRRAATGHDVAALEAEWRALYAWAWADFERFLAGWAPSWRIQRHERALTQRVLALL